MPLTSASALSDVMEARLLNWLKGTAFAAAPATTYVGLFTTNPADAGTSASPQDGTEVSTTNGSLGYSAYARQAITSSSGWSSIAADATDSTGQAISNANQITFPANNGGSSITITGVGLWDASTGGNLLFWMALTSSQPIANGNALALPATTGLTITID